MDQCAQNPSPKESQAVPAGRKPFVGDSQQKQRWDLSKVIRILVQVSYGFHLEAGLTRQPVDRPAGIGAIERRKRIAFLSIGEPADQRRMQVVGYGECRQAGVIPTIRCQEYKPAAGPEDAVDLPKDLQRSFKVLQHRSGNHQIDRLGRQTSMRQVGLDILNSHRLRSAHVHTNGAGHMGRQVSQEGRRVSAPCVQEDAMGPHVSHSFAFEDAVRMSFGRVVLRNQRGCSRGHTGMYVARLIPKSAVFRNGGVGGLTVTPYRWFGRDLRSEWVTYNMRWQ